MKVVYKNNYSNPCFTQNKIYTVGFITFSSYIIVDDKGDAHNINKSFFISLDEYREMQLNKILNE